MSRTPHPRKRRTKQWGISCISPEGERTWMRGPGGRVLFAFSSRAEARSFLASGIQISEGWKYTPQVLP